MSTARKKAEAFQKQGVDKKKNKKNSSFSTDKDSETQQQTEVITTEAVRARVRARHQGKPQKHFSRRPQTTKN